MRKAKVFGWWDFPLEDVGADNPEMNANDSAYWHYASGNPITKTKQEVSEAVFQSGISAVGLPGDFETESSFTVGAAGDLI